MKDPTTRFSDRVENYVRYRPGYPKDIIPYLEKACGLNPETIVADVGSGTGILSQRFLERGCTVYGVEPNREMRVAGERLLGDYPRFHSVAGRAEATELPDGSVDMITAGQAFHWFDRQAARAEFARILKPGGHVVLIWNSRVTDDPFGDEYEQILKDHAPEYDASGHRHVDDEALQSFFHTSSLHRTSFANAQGFDFKGLKGRVLSASYTPQPGEPNHAPLVDALFEAFNRHAIGGRVRILYDTQVCHGTLT